MGPLGGGVSREGKPVLFYSEHPSPSTPPPSSVGWRSYAIHPRPRQGSGVCQVPALPPPPPDREVPGWRPTGELRTAQGPRRRPGPAPPRPHPVRPPASSRPSEVRRGRASPTESVSRAGAASGWSPRPLGGGGGGGSGAP